MIIVNDSTGILSSISLRSVVEGRVMVVSPVVLLTFRDYTRGRAKILRRKYEILLKTGRYDAKPRHIGGKF